MTDLKRSATMRAVKAKDTGPEMQVRRFVHNLGFRYRLHRKDLPGKPDLVFPELKRAIFVHGCFWHGHSCSRGARIPKSNTDYWVEKVRKNTERDAVQAVKLRELGWNSMIVWECDLGSNRAATESAIRAFLEKEPVVTKSVRQTILERRKTLNDDKKTALPWRKLKREMLARHRKP